MNVREFDTLCLVARASSIELDKAYDRRHDDPHGYFVAAAAFSEAWQPVRDAVREMS